MAIDILLAATGIFLIILGIYDGLIIQVLNIVALLLAVVLAPFVSTEIRHFSGVEYAFGSPLFEASSWVAAAFGLYLILTFVGRAVIYLMRRASTTLGIADRIAGGVLGVLKTIIVAYVILTTFILIKSPLRQLDPEDKLYTEKSEAVRFFKENNIFLPWQLPDLPTFNAMLVAGDAAKSSRNAARLREHHPKAADLLRDPRIQELLEDKEIVAAAHRNDWATTIADPRIRAIFSDPSFQNEFSSVDWIHINEEFTPQKKSSKVHRGGLAHQPPKE